MMSPLASVPASGPSAVRSSLTAGAGDAMSSAFAMLFALVPGMGGDATAETGEAAKQGKGKTGGETDKDGKPLPSDATLLPTAVPPLPILPVEETTVAAPTDAVRASAAPITTLLATMPVSPEQAMPVATSTGDGAAPADAVASSGTTGLAKAPRFPSEALPVAADIPAQAMAAPGDGQALATTASATRTTAPLPSGTGSTLRSTGEAALATLSTDSTVTQATREQGPALRSDVPARFAATAQAVPLAAPPTAEASAPILQTGQTAPALQLFAGAMRAAQDEPEERSGRRKDAGLGAIDPATLTRADSLTAAPVAAMTGAEQAPLDMTQGHWPQGMIDRIERMREDAATADTRIQLSPDALGGIAVALRHEDGATHIHFTADQAQTATMLADAQPTLARLAEEKGMRLGQTAVDLGQSGGGGGERQPQRQPEPVLPTRPALAGGTASSDAGDAPADATTRIA
ncbi:MULTISPECIES: flagellar hook-length control protein FliK [unclassified Sphingomonas]|uniref:flagellar hook-length control protein FliK n=1 Tax=unclassified Sphingomonas TaxID=196159 RepID=UPI0028567E14|nr:MULTISPECIES: flagellar hook-length control protein FliK [unclassified Sphingomonas]MDR6114070.1 flagellar hook-length control protein FliK [Sphingomonas sp. SORGH_AS_0789]MDR6148570.1 flagellar hook-length control protein FliK [Sphingomonas sp. SORGH_AS_0742]